MAAPNSLDNETFTSAMHGAIAGLFATVPMTVVMKGIRQQLPFWQRGRLPPEQITMEMAEKIDIAKDLDRDERKALTLAGHFGYGAMSGSAYGAFAEQVRLPPMLGGAGFGLAVWAASYLGWLPVAGVRRSATQEPAGTNLMMIASHLVWGITTAHAYESLRSRK
ncbi:MAG: DUF1440 domain-containing protein [Pirellulales bacterium]